ncbi:malate synthase A [Aeromicrobium sp. REDSEA-S38_B2]|jgi:malate synthase|uniref:malate synthase A n=1 Tax=Aeromicrobium sp. REDSEA-S38_B2 TaxID=1811528 RepID=UPI000AF877ED|nr:malate synthase A [Aeromicrobium sp. REDSEA-S38_B2]
MCAPTRNDMQLLGPVGPRDHEVFSDGGLGILRMLHDRFDGRRRELLRLRRDRDLAAGPGGRPDFLPETAGVREDPSWRVAGAGPGLEDRRVEITGPVDRKMTINALNSGAQGWLADFEDATSPSWRNVVDGQLNLHDAVSRVIEHEENSKRYVLEDGPLATIIVRPRGLHLDEEHLRIKGAPIAGALFDFGLYVHHNARRLIEQGTGPYFYLPKLESHLEARWWDDVFTRTEQWLRIPHGTIRATVLIETLPAAFEMEEILYELRDHAAGLNAGRWDYIFSTIKNLGADPAYVLPDRADVTMTVPFMRAYTELLVKTCHRRGAHAIGGMAAVIPSRDEDRNRDALAKVRADKEREAAAGYDGSWVAHPGLVATCRDAFTEVLGDRPNQVDRQRDDVEVSAADLLDVAATPGEVTAQGLRANVSVLVRYVDAWLDGRGAVGLDGLMEDAATAEISRCQLWQWCRHATPIDGGGVVTRFRVAALLEQELDALEQAGRPPERIEALRHVVRRGALGDDLPAFLTDDAYRRFLVTREEAAA